METPNKTTEQPVEKTEQVTEVGNLTFHFHYRENGINYTVNVKAKTLNEALISFAKSIEGVEEIYKVVQKAEGNTDTSK